MRVQRVTRRSTSPFGGFCGCLAVVSLLVVLIGAAAVLVIVPMLPGFALQVAGFVPAGRTDQVFVGNVQPVDVALDNPVSAASANLQTGSGLSWSIPAGTGSVQTGGQQGVPAAAVRLTETDLMSLCQTQTTFCAGGNDAFRNARVDLRPDGAVIYADVYLRDLGLWQPAGVVLRLDASRQQFYIAGVDVGGTLYAVPDGTLGDQVRRIAEEGNAALRGLAAEVGGGRYVLQSLTIDDTSITALLRGF
ncbi:MAG: hypothetical protein JNM70_05285 [Anaerolineae bacterium]|nr:hypothetical protein [Anaerolineae bacterium]